MLRRSLLLATLSLVAAHKHGHELSDEEANAPIDAILWIHIALQAAVWGILFPIGMVLGLSRSRYHVPLQATGFALTLSGYILGHTHGGRKFLASAHGKFANILLLPIFLQLSLGIYLKLHLAPMRNILVKCHKVIGISYPMLGWTQMLFGAIAFRGFCRGGELGQCLAHYIMGSGFIAYACIMAILFLVGEEWIRRRGRSPEFWDSCVITAWGIVNTFTEHHGGRWSAKDMQHTTMGILWWATGILGIYLSKNNQRTVIPSLVVILTGWGMSNHAQHLELSTKVHSMFGYALMAAGLARMIEVCFVVPSYGPPTTLSNEAIPDDSGSDHTLAPGRSATADLTKHAIAFRHLPPFLLVCAGILFMSATDEEIRYIHDIQMDHVTYILIMFSLSSIIYLIMIYCIDLYSTSGRNSSSSVATTGGAIELVETPARGRFGVTGNPRVVDGYKRVPNAPHHVLGEDDDDDELEEERRR